MVGNEGAGADAALPETRENGKVRKVKEYSTGERLTIAVFEGGLIRRLNKEWIPCDEAEYLEYQKSKQ